MRIQREENSDLQMNEPSQWTYLSWQRGHHRLVLPQGGGRSPKHEYYGRAWQGRGAVQAEMQYWDNKGQKTMHAVKAEV